MKTSNHILGIRAGRLFEEQFFGPRYFYEKDFRVFRPFDDALHHVKMHQCKIRWNPAEPATPLSKKLFDAIRDNEVWRGQRPRLRFFAAIGSSLDLHWKTDCFFEANGNLVTIDLTLQRWKRMHEAMRPDFFIRPTCIDQKFDATVEKIARTLFHRAPRQPFLTKP